MLSTWREGGVSGCEAERKRRIDSVKREQDSKYEEEMRIREKKEEEVR